MTSRDLERENEALNEQVKLLVKTEQRLYRSQRQLDQELQRIQLLGNFALETTGIEAPENILRRGLNLLRDCFPHSTVLALRIDADEGVEWIDREAPPRIDADLVAEFLEQSTDAGPLVGELRSLPRAVANLIRALAERRETEVGVGYWVPLQTQDGVCHLLGYESSGRPSFHSQLPSIKHGPFLRLVASHIDHALRGASLTSALATQSRELAEANERLSASLTHLERTQKQLIQARKLEAVGHLAGGVAHDFNNLLTVILGHAQLLHDSLPADSPLHTEVDEISAAGDRGSRITRQLLAFSRRETTRPEPVDLNEVTREMMHMLAGLVGEQVRVEFKQATQPSRVRADRTQIEQIVLNLVINARDAMPDGGVVRISTQRARAEDLAETGIEGDPGDFVALTVKDTGRGMDETTCSRIFEPFFSTKGVRHGTGLGLFVVYGAVTQNQGKISVSSEPGRGSIFTIVFPAAAGAASTSQVQTREAAPDSAKILFVDDKDGIRSLFAKCLRRRGYEVSTASNGVEALRFLETSPEIDLLITDIVMPEMGGIELSTAAHKLFPELPILYISGFASDEAKRIARTQEGAFLEKPFTPSELLRYVERILAARVLGE